MSPSKIRRLPDLRRVVERYRRAGTRIILANGCFDLLHIGHVRYLEEAKALGGLLVVGINGNRSVRRLKGRGRPLMGESVRAELVAGLSCTDFVTIFHEPNVEKLIRTLRPHIHAKGGDYTPATVPERETVKAVGGRVVIVGGPKVRSTRDLIREVHRRWK